MAIEIDFQQARVLSQWAYTRPLLGVRFDPLGRFAVTSSEDNQLQRWTLAEEPPQPKVFTSHDSWVHALQFTPDGSRLISGGCDGRLAWWNIEGSLESPERTAEAHQGWIRALDCNREGSQVASCGNDQLVKVWETSTGKLLHTLVGHERHVYSVLFHPDGKQLISGDIMGKLHLWNLADGTLTRSFDCASLHTYEGGQQVDFGGVRTLAFNSDASRLAAGGLHKATNPLGAVHEPLCLRFDFASGELKKSQVAEGIAGGVIWRLQMLADGTLVAVSGGSSGGWLLFFDEEGETAKHRFQLPNIARDMDIHPEGNRIATSHHDGQLRITALYAASPA